MKIDATIGPRQADTPSGFYPAVHFDAERQLVLISFRHPTSGEKVEYPMTPTQVIDYAARLLDSCKFMLSLKK